MVAVLFAIKVEAQDSEVPSQKTPVVLSSAVTDVLKLVRSKVGEDTVVAFINGSAATYRLGAAEIIYLKDQGASDKVITAMLIQRGTTPTPAQSAPFYTQPPSTVYVVQPQSATPQTPTEYVVPPEPAYVQPSPVYVAAPAPIYPFYYPYYGTFYPRVSFSFGYGYGGYRGYAGYHGGYYSGGGYHGGGGVGYHSGGGHSGRR